MTSSEFASRLRRRERLVGYWSVLDCPVAHEWVAHVGYDYIALDLQHGLIDYSGMLAGLTAIEAAHGPVGMIRVEANDPTPIGRALDAGATGVIVPLINTAAEAAAAVSAATYPPTGIRSYGPMRAQLRIGPTPAVANSDTVVLAMIETPQGLENVESICATEGLDGVYVGPSDLRLAVGGAHSQTPPSMTNSKQHSPGYGKLPPPRASRLEFTPPTVPRPHAGSPRVSPSPPSQPIWCTSNSSPPPTSKPLPKGSWPASPTGDPAKWNSLRKSRD